MCPLVVLEGPMGLAMKPIQIVLMNGTKLEVLQITDASQSNHPEVKTGDIIGSINNNALVAKEGMTSATYAMSL